MTFRKFVNALQTIHTIMVNNAKNATCPGTGTSPLLNAKNALKKATTILSLKSALPAQTTILFGMAQYGQHWDITLSKCIPCPTGQAYNTVKNQCICPVEAPFMLANGTCVTCDRPQYWNEKDKKCVTCV